MRTPTTSSSDLPRPECGLFAPVDGASLAFFRILFGGLIVVEVLRFLFLGRVAEYYVEPVRLFKYLGFGWVTAPPGAWMYAYFVGVGVLGACVMLGRWYRLTSALLCLGFAYWFLLDKAQYLNHLYLTGLLCLLLACVPAHRVASLDARNASLPATVPRWSLWIFRAQFAIVYFYAGFAKVGGDWQEGAPMARWLAAEADMPLFGPLLSHPNAVPFFVWGGMLFDLGIAPLLLWKRTRVAAVVLSLAFHGLNFLLFHIGIFPFLMLAATTLFFEPDWPRRFGFARRSPSEPTRATLQSDRSRLVVPALLIYFVVQVLVPLRHFAYPGNVHWTEEGHVFAWHMLLRSKQASAPRFLVTDPSTGRSWSEPVDRWLGERQYKKVAQWPDMAHQCAQMIAERERLENGRDVEVRVRAQVALNGRTPALMIDPRADLASLPRSLAPATWIQPLDVPLPEPLDER